MNSLQELNNFANQPTDFIDARPAGVKFDREFPLTAEDQIITINTTTVVPQPGINIVEIINYQTANVRYRVKIVTGQANPLVGSTISWATLPSHITLTVSGSEYTLSGITSAKDWNAVKLFTWSLPFNYASYPLWYVTAEIIYFDETLNQEITRDWNIYDDRFYYVAQLNGTALLNNTYGVSYAIEIDLAANASTYFNPENKLKFDAALTSSAAINCNIAVNGIVLLAYATVSVPLTLASKSASSNLTARASISCTITTSATNFISRTYESNNINAIFNLNTPTVGSTNPLSDTVSITLSSSLGKWEFSGNENTTSPLNSITLSGTVSYVNANISKILFFPNPGTTSAGTISWAQSVNGQLVFTGSIGISGVATAYRPQIVDIYTLGSNSWTPAWTHVNYGNKIDLLIVSGGGAGGRIRDPFGPLGVSLSGGGGAGGIRVVNDISITAGQLATVYIGAGGIWDGFHSVPSTGWNVNQGEQSYVTISSQTYSSGGGEVGGDGANSTSGAGGRSGISISATGVQSRNLGGAQGGYAVAGGGGGGVDSAGSAGAQASSFTAVGGRGGSGTNGASLGWRYPGQFFAGGGGGGSAGTGQDGINPLGLGVDGGGDGGVNVVWGSGPLDAKDGTPSTNTPLGNYNFGGGGGGSHTNYNTTVFPIGKPGRGGQGFVRIVAHT